MDIFNTFKGTVGTMVDSVSALAQNYVERNRTKAKLNRLRMVMKSESELMNRAYIALGKDYYEILKTGKGEPTDRQQKLLQVIDNSKAKIARARECYRKIQEKENDFLYSASVSADNNYEAEDVRDITVACSNESDYKSSPFPAAEEKAPENGTPETAAPTDKETSKAETPKDEPPKDEPV